MNSPVDVLLHVQHLLGIGHIRRAALLARALDRAGLTVVLVSGGLPVADLDIGGAGFLQLPAAKAADAGFSGLVDETGRPVDEAWKAARRHRLLAAFARLRPRLLLLELFPFGRRALRFELLPLLEAARRERSRPPVVCSLRDVLNPIRKPEKEAWILGTARRHLDRVLVHGDPAFLPLEASFPAAAEIADLIRYTGYVAPPPAAGDEVAVQIEGEILVSTGGGAVAAPLIAGALAARPRSRHRERPWRILAGRDLPEGQFLDFIAQAPPGVTIERARRDFPALLRRCALSVSQGGYNTVTEVLGAGRPAVIVPFATDGEREQTLRAERLAARGLITLVRGEDLDGRSLARAIDEAFVRGPASGPAVDMRGAENTASELAEILTRGPG